MISFCVITYHVLLDLLYILVVNISNNRREIVIFLQVRLVRNNIVYSLCNFSYLSFKTDSKSDLR